MRRLGRMHHRRANGGDWIWIPDTVAKNTRAEPTEVARS